MKNRIPFCCPPELAAATVTITLGEGVTLGLNDDNILMVEDAFVRFSLGRTTKKRIEELQDYLERLKIHCPD
jgi:hypothetical protein